MTKGVPQFSAPLGTRDFVSAAVRALAGEQRRLTEAIASLFPAFFKTQLLLLRLCAGPRASHWMRALRLQAGAQRASAMDRDAGDVLARLLWDARDAEPVRSTLLGHAALLPAIGGMGIGGRTQKAVPAALASWIDALRAGISYVPVLRDLSARLRARSVVSAGWVVDAPPSPTPLY